MSNKMRASLESTDLGIWIAHHASTALWIASLSLSVSLLLVLRMWILYRRAKFVKKAVWSLVLFVPIFGWIFYAGLFDVPSESDVRCGESSVGF